MFFFFFQIFNPCLLEGRLSVTMHSTVDKVSRWKHVKTSIKIVISHCCCTVSNKQKLCLSPYLVKYVFGKCWAIRKRQGKRQERIEKFVLMFWFSRCLTNLSYVVSGMHEAVLSSWFLVEYHLKAAVISLFRLANGCLMWSVLLIVINPQRIIPWLYTSTFFSERFNILSSYSVLVHSHRSHVDPSGVGADQNGAKGEWML